MLFDQREKSYLNFSFQAKNRLPEKAVLFWHTMADSNRRHQASEACALSIWANGAYVGKARFACMIPFLEPHTIGMKAKKECHYMFFVT